MEQNHQHLRNSSVIGERLLNVALAIGKTGLLQIFCISADHDDFFTCQRCSQGQTIKAIVFDLPGPNTSKRIFKFCLDGGEIKIFE